MVGTNIYYEDTFKGGNNMKLKPAETEYVMANELLEPLQNQLYGYQLCNADSRALLNAILLQYQRQYNEARKEGKEVDRYELTVFEKDLEGFIKELSTAKTIKPKRLLEKKIQAVFALSSYTNIHETKKLSETETEHLKYQLFVLKVVTEQIPINVLNETVPKEILDACKISDFQAIKSYTFKTTVEGTDYINRMFSSIGTGYSYYLLGLTFTLKTDTAKRLLMFLCKYMNAIIQGQWNNGGQVVFKIDTVYEACGIRSKNPKINKDTLMKALEEVNEALLAHFNMTDKEGQPIQIACKYYKNGEYGYNTWLKADKETHIQFYTQEIENLEKLSKPNSTAKQIVDSANKQSLKDLKKFKHKEEPKAAKQSNHDAEIKEIIDYLNVKAGTKYTYKAKITVKNINARLKEGYTVADFKKVIDNKILDWYDTEMAQYLRPETLFGNKFEGYLNAKVKGKKQPSYHLNTGYVPNSEFRRVGNGTNIDWDNIPERDPNYNKIF